MAETKCPSDFICDGILNYGVDVGRFVFQNTGKTVYAVSALPHIGPSDVMMFYQISTLDYQRLLGMSLSDRIPEPPVPASAVERSHRRFLCGESAYCKRYAFSVFQADLSLTEDTKNEPKEKSQPVLPWFRVPRKDVITLVEMRKDRHPWGDHPDEKYRCLIFHEDGVIRMTVDEFHKVDAHAYECCRFYTAKLCSTIEELKQLTEDELSSRAYNAWCSGAR